MHKKILEAATPEQIKEFVRDTLSMLKATDKDLYDKLEMDLYKEVYGCHFNDWLLECALDKMQNEDGTMGGHWTLEQTNSVAKQNGILFTNFNEYDWNYVMNMMYSDYYGVVSNEVSSYVKLAKKFLMDKDAPSGKAYHYYMAMKKY